MVAPFTQLRPQGEDPTAGGLAATADRPPAMTFSFRLACSPVPQQSTSAAAAASRRSWFASPGETNMQSKVSQYLQTLTSGKVNKTVCKCQEILGAGDLHQPQQEKKGLRKKN